MRRSWLYLATRSERESEPVLSCSALLPTAMSAMVVSSVSPVPAVNVDDEPATALAVPPEPVMGELAEPPEPGDCVGLPALPAAAEVAGASLLQPINAELTPS